MEGEPISVQQVYRGDAFVVRTRSDFIESAIRRVHGEEARGVVPSAQVPSRLMHSENVPGFGRRVHPNRADRVVGDVVARIEGGVAGGGVLGFGSAVHGGASGGECRRAEQGPDRRQCAHTVSDAARDVGVPSLRVPAGHGQALPLACRTRLLTNEEE